MRLLELKSNGDVCLTNDLIDDIPPYAILSHTWGNDDGEVTFKDLTEGSGKTKCGYDKILFCATQASKDGLRYIWIDTCCIDKSSSAELSEAINSMFRWYHSAVKCYVYLSDVSINSSTERAEAGKDEGAHNAADYADPKDLDQEDDKAPGKVEDEQSSHQTWKPAFHYSRWFTRGWTLQELIAPKSVEFFSVEGQRLGDRKSLEQQIHEITGIDIHTLRGSPLSRLSIDHRMAWAAKRNTKRGEDGAYSLLGLFDVHIPLIYGEGRRKAFLRLQNAVKESLMNRSLTLPSALFSKDENAFGLREGTVSLSLSYSLP